MTSPRRDRHPLLQQLPFILVLTLVAIAAVRIGMYHWRQGAALIAGALLVAAVLRAVLGEEQAGLLAIRGKVIDVLVYGALGAMILFVALTIAQGPTLALV